MPRTRTAGEDKNFNLLRTIDPQTPNATKIIYWLSVALPKTALETGFLVFAAPVELFSGYGC